MQFFRRSLRIISVALLCIGATSSPRADDNPYRTSVALPQTFDLRSVDQAAAQSRPVAQSRRRIRPIELRTRVRGVGWVSARFDRHVPQTWNSFVRSDRGNRRDTFPVLLLEGGIRAGHANRSGHDEPAAASIINGRLRISFRGPVRNGRVRHYTLVGTPHGRSMKARVTSVPASVARNKSCGVSTANGRHVHSGASITEDSSSIAGDVTAQAARELTIATDFDPLFFARFGSTSNAEIAARVSAASVIYERDLDIVLRIETQNGYTSGSPYTSTNPSTRLSQFRTNSDRFSLRGVVDSQMLFSGVDFDGSTVGIAYVSVTCQVSGQYSYGIVQYLSPTLDYLIFAHELGHNLGVENHTSTGIMSAVLNGSTSFSSDAQSLIGTYISSYGSCLTAPGGQPTATPTPVATSTPTATPTNVGSDPGSGVPLPTATPTVAVPTPLANPVVTLTQSSRPKIVVKYVQGKRKIFQQVKFRGSVRSGDTGSGYPDVQLDVWVGNSQKKMVRSNASGDYSIRLNLAHDRRSVVRTTFVNTDSLVVSSNAVTIKRSDS